MIFVGNLKETEIEEREATMLFGTQENSHSFSIEYCSPFTFSQE
jgi:hypothetical protein